MALREVTVEITTRYIVKFTANNSYEARKKAGEIEVYELEPYYRDEVILDVQPISKSVEPIENNNHGGT